MAERKRIGAQTEALVLSRSARRCCLCFHLRQDFGEKLGQIAHLDQDPSNGSEDNLAFLCMDHHSLYDSTASQHKNFTIAEAKAARAKLYEEVEGRNLCEWVLVLDGTFSELNKARVEAIVDHLRKLLGDPHLTIKRSDGGSIRLTIESSAAAYDKMRLLVRNGSVGSVLDYPIREIVRAAIEGPAEHTLAPSAPPIAPVTPPRRPPLQFPPPSPPIVYGSREWLDEFFIRQRPLLVNYFAHYGLAHSAEDLAEEVFIRFLSRHYRDKPVLEAERSSSRLDTLLRGIAHNMVGSAYRQTRREFPIEDFPEETFATEQPKLDLELSTELQEALSALSPRDRAVVTFRLLDWSIGDIATALGITRRAALTIHSRALKHLRSAMEKLRRRE